MRPLLLLLLPLLGGAPESTLTAPKLRLVKATEARSTSHETVTGSLFASKTLPLGFELGGRLVTSKVARGETVKAGQVLGALDQEIVSAQVAQAEAAVLAAEAAAGLASDVAGRTEKLKGEGSVSDVQSKQTDTQAKATQAQLLMAKAGLAQAKAAKRRHTLVAPSGGTLVDAPDQVGTMVGPGMPVYIVQQLDPLIMKATIPENVRGQVKAGLKVRVESVGSGAMTDDATVKVVIASADPATRRIPIEVTVPNADARFVANTLARLTLPIGAARPAFVIPTTALGSAGGEHVFAVTAKGELKRVPVTVLERGPREVTVQPADAQRLDEVVDYPTSALVEGTKVTSR